MTPGIFDSIGQLGGNSGPAISGGSPVFQIAAAQPSFLRQPAFFAGAHSNGGLSGLSWPVAAVGALSATALAVAYFKK
ncbi:hypothetical protein [Kordiimonas aquimaris]|uniref:hypothetical protein n=1 Tax=Kordiimonas aquimaris TaxID=707591 RepID=UPI0021D1F999|nr:hypothetical protein [Kordiimonas aquimaris]